MCALQVPGVTCMQTLVKNEPQFNFKKIKLGLGFSYWMPVKCRLHNIFSGH